MTYFNQSNYFKEKFHKLFFTDETIREVEFEQCQFTDCTFINCRLNECHFYNLKFINCSLSAVIPTDSRFIDVSFKDSKAIGIDWTKARSIQSLSFENCQVNFSNFRQLKIPNTKMIACEAKEVDFNETDISNSDFHSSDLDQSVFHKTNLSGSDFRDAKNYLIDPRNNSLKKANFSLPDALSLLQSFDISIS